MNNSNLDNHTKSPNSESIYDQISLRDYSESEISSTLNAEKAENNSATEQSSEQRNKIKTLVLDLDETLVHSSFDYVENPDIIIPIIIEEVAYEIYVLVRPGTKEFISELSKFFEIVIFTASISEYADPLISLLDPNYLCKFRLFRDHCTYIDGTYVKDLNKMGRHLRNIVIVDNSPISYSFHKNNGIPIKSWYEDKSDRDLIKIIPYLQNLSAFYDVRTEIPKFVINNTIIWKKAYEWFEEYNLLNSSNTEIQTKIIKSTISQKSVALKESKNIITSKQSSNGIEDSTTNLKIKQQSPNPKPNEKNEKESSDYASNIKARKESKESKEHKLKILNIITQKPYDESSSNSSNISYSKGNHNLKDQESLILKNYKINTNSRYCSSKKISDEEDNQFNDLNNLEINENNIDIVEFTQSDDYLGTNKSEMDSNANNRKQEILSDKKTISDNFNKKENNGSKEHKKGLNSKKDMDISSIRNIIFQSKNILKKKQNINKISNKKNETNQELNKNASYCQDSEAFNLHNNTDSYLNNQNSYSSHYINSTTEKKDTENKNLNITNKPQDYSQNAKTIIDSTLKQDSSIISKKIYYSNSNRKSNFNNFHTDSNVSTNKEHQSNLIKNNNEKNIENNFSNNKHYSNSKNKQISLTETNIMSFNEETPNFNSNLNNFIMKLTDSNDYDDTNIMYPSSVLHTDPIENDEDLMERDNNSKQNPLDLLPDNENISLLSNTADATNLNAKNININIINGDYNKIILNDNSSINKNKISNLNNNNNTNNNPNCNASGDMNDFSCANSTIIKNNIHQNKHVKTDSNNIMENTEYRGPNKNESAFPKRIVSKIKSLSDSSDISAKFTNKAANEIENELFTNFLFKNKEEILSKQNQIAYLNTNQNAENLNKVNNNIVYKSELIQDLSDYDNIGNNSNFINISSSVQNMMKNNENSNSFNKSKKLFKNFNSNKLNSKSKYFVEKKIEDLKTILQKETYNPYSNFNTGEIKNDINNFNTYSDNINNAYFSDEKVTQNTTKEKFWDKNNAYNYLNTEEESLKFYNAQEKISQNSFYVHKYLKTDESVSNKKKIDINRLIQTQKTREQKEKVLKKSCLNSNSFKMRSNTNKGNVCISNPISINNRELNVNKIISNLKCNQNVSTNENNNLINYNNNKNTELGNSIKKIISENYNLKSNYNSYNIASKKINNLSNNINNSSSFNINNNSNNLAQGNRYSGNNTNSNFNTTNNNKLADKRNTSIMFYTESSKNSLQKNSTQINFSGFTPSRNIVNTENNSNHEKSEELISVSNNKNGKNNIVNNKKQSYIYESTEINNMRIPSKKNIDLDARILNSTTSPKNIKNNNLINNKSPNVGYSNYNGNNKQLMSSYNSKSRIKKENNISSLENNNSKIFNTKDPARSNNNFNKSNINYYSLVDNSNIKEKPKLNLNQSISGIPQIIKIEALSNDSSNNNIKIPSNNASRDKKRNNGNTNFNNFEITFKNQDEDFNQIINKNYNYQTVNSKPKSIRASKLPSNIDETNTDNKNHINNKNYLIEDFENLKIKDSEKDVISGSVYTELIEEKTDLSSKNSLMEIYNKTNNFLGLHQNSKNFVYNNQMNHTNSINYENNNNNNNLNLNFVKDNSPNELSKDFKSQSEFFNSSEHSSNNNLSHSKIFNNLKKKNNNPNNNSNLLLNAYDDIQIKENQENENNDLIRRNNQPDNRRIIHNSDTNKLINLENKNFNLAKNNANNNNTFNMFSHYFNLIHKNNNNCNKSKQPLNFSDNSKLEISNPKDRSYMQNTKNIDNSNNTNNINNSINETNLMMSVNNNKLTNKSDLNYTYNNISNEKYNLVSYTESNMFNNNNNSLVNGTNKKSVNLSNYKYENVNNNRIDILINKNPNAANTNFTNTNLNNNLLGSANLSIDKAHKKNTSNFLNMNANKNNTLIFKNKEDKNAELKSTPVTENKKNSIIDIKTDLNLKHKGILNGNKCINTKKNVDPSKLNIPNKNSNEIYIAENPKIQFAYNTPINNNIGFNNNQTLSLQNQIKQKNLTKSFSNSNISKNEQQKATSNNNNKSHITHNILGSKIILHNNPNTDLINVNNNFYANENNFNKNNLTNNNLNQYASGNNVYQNNFKNFDNKPNKKESNNMSNMERMKNSINNINFGTNSLLSNKEDKNNYSLNTKEYLQSVNPNKINMVDNAQFFSDKKFNNFSLANEERNIYLNTQPNKDNVNINIRGDSIPLNTHNNSALNRPKTKNVLENSKIQRIKK